MSGRFRRNVSGRSRRKAFAWRETFGACLAGLALYVQVLAGAFCAAGAVGVDALGNSPFPICHSQSKAPAPVITQADDNGVVAATDLGDEHRSGNSDTPGNRPNYDHGCPFCTTHCHSAMATAPAIGGLAAPLVVAVTTRQADLVFPSPARFYSGVSPRGPPAA